MIKKTFGRISQVAFTFKSISRLAYEMQPWVSIATFLLNILSGVLVAPSLYLQKLLIDEIVAGIDSPNQREVLISIGVIISFTVAISLTTTFIDRVLGHLNTVMARTFDAKLNLMLAKKLSELDITTIESPSFKNRYTKIEQEAPHRAYQMIGPFSSLPGDLASLLSAIAILITLSPFVALGVFISSLPRVLVNSSFIKRRYAMVTENAPRHRVLGWLSYYLVRNKNFMELKLLNLAPYLTNKYSEVQDLNLGKVFDLNRRWESSLFWSFIPLIIFDAFVTLWMGFLTITKALSIGSFQLYFQSLRRVQGDFRSVVNSLMNVYEQYIYVSELFWFLDLKPKIDNEIGEDVSINNELVIEFKDVWFRYKKSQKWILRGINLKFNLGENTAIVGVNGAGKSTLLKLLCRFYDPGKGEILVNGTPLNKIKPSSWRRALAVLFQEFEQYPFSAHESIGYGDVERIDNINEIKEAAKRTDIDDFIEGLPLKYETPLHPEFDKGVRPSIGQWQRIGISRMLFRKNANVIVMDEPTSNVDPEAEEKIFKELVSLSTGRILIFVTQRFSTVRLADKIVVIEKGKVVETGTHSTLYSQKGRYKTLFDLQAEGYNTKHEK